jgi:alpha-2-macroglobulin
LRFSSALGTARDDVEVTVPVHDAAPMDVYAVYGSLAEDGTAGTEILVPEDARPDRGGLTITVSATLAGALERAMEWLRDYPYTCLEQQTSRALMYGVRLALSDRFAASPVTSEQAAAGLEEWAANLAGFQSWEGGFDWWPSTYGPPREDPYLTAYVLFSLHYLQAMGHEAPPYVSDRALDYLESVVRHNRWPWYYTEEARRETRAFTLSVLGRWGRLSDALLATSMGEREKLSLFALASLMDAQLQLGGKGRAYEQLQAALQNRAVVRPGETHYQEVEDDALDAVLSSPVRSNARVLLLFSAADPGGEAGERLMRWLMQAQRAGRWDNTHDNAFCVLAAHEYLRLWEKKAPRFQVTAQLAGAGGAPEAAAAPAQALGQWRFGRFGDVQAHEVPAAELPRGEQVRLELEKHGAGRMYYGLRLAFAREAPSPEPLNAGFAVLRQYFAEAGQAEPTSGPFERGQLVRVRVTISVPAVRHFVAIEDPLPAGFEAVNLRLATESRLEAAAFAGAAQEEGWDRWYQHVEKRDDRVVVYSTVLPAGTYTYEYLARATTAGTFRAGPAQAEEMYSPEVRGRGMPASVVVTAEAAAPR